MRAAGCLLAFAVATPRSAVATVASPAPDGPLRPAIRFAVTAEARVDATWEAAAHRLRLRLYGGEQPPRGPFAAHPDVRSVTLDVDGARWTLLAELDPAVVDVTVAREGDSLAIRFDAPADGSAAPEPTVDRHADGDLLAVLSAVEPDPVESVSFGPFRVPAGLRSPAARPAPDRPVFANADPPASVRAFWTGWPALSRGAAFAERGDGPAAVASIGTFVSEDDSARAAVALLRGYAWSRPGARGEPARPGRAAWAFRLAAGLRPDAAWAAWARGAAAWLHLADRDFAAAVAAADSAIALAPADPSRPRWEIAAGLARLAAGHRDGALRCARWLGALSPADPDALEALSSLVDALAREGDARRAARVRDLLIARAGAAPRGGPARQVGDALILIGAGRPAQAGVLAEAAAIAGLDPPLLAAARFAQHEAHAMLGAFEASRAALHAVAEGGASLSSRAALRILAQDAIATRRYASAASALRAAASGSGPVDAEALALSAQATIAAGAEADGLEALAGLDARGLLDRAVRDEILCAIAPAEFDALRGGPRPARAAGFFLRFLDRGAAASCAGLDRRLDAATAASSAGAFATASRLLDAASAGDGADAEAARLRLAELHLDEGRLDAARRALDAVDVTRVPGHRVAAVEAAILAHEGRIAEARAVLDAALLDASSSARGRAAMPSLLALRDGLQGRAPVGSSRLDGLEAEVAVRDARWQDRLDALTR